VIEYATGLACVPALEVKVRDEIDATELIVYATELIVIVSPFQSEFASNCVPDTHVTVVPLVVTYPTAPPVI
jgi:hypothetical protein